MSAINCNFTLL